MIVGALGEIVFEVSERVVRTAKDLSWSGAARIATHARHNYHSLTEYTGIEPDKYSLSMQLSKYLGTDPLTELRKLWKYEREGIPVTLVLGDHVYGKNKWLVSSHNTDMETFDQTGTVTACTVAVNLVEYLEN